MTKVLGESKFDVKKIGRYCGDYYSVDLMSGRWPEDQELINICDTFNLGGFINYKNTAKALVVVYTD